MKITLILATLAAINFGGCAYNSPGAKITVTTTTNASLTPMSPATIIP